MAASTSAIHLEQIGLKMPTENERKFVLKFCEEEIKAIADKKLDIHQGYLDSGSSRIRHTEIMLEKSHKFVFTFKKRVNGRVVEIERSISQRDFLDLWDSTHSKLRKIRYNVKSEGYVWEVDFFKTLNDKKTYFAMAEVELPEGKEMPDSVPSFIKDNLLYLVDEGDDRFSSKSLSDHSHADDMLELIKVYKDGAS